MKQHIADKKQQKNTIETRKIDIQQLYQNICTTTNRVQYVPNDCN